MISAKFLKNSARLSSTLCDQNAGALDLDFRRLQGPRSGVSIKKDSVREDLNRQHLTLNGHSMVLKTALDEEADEMMVTLEEE